MASSQEPLKILSLDGGGIRALSSLLILEDIMEKIRDKNGLHQVPRPCDHFDLIGGTGTGGIIAIMLGRLRMSVNECIQEYRDFARQAFSRKSMRIFSSNAQFGPVLSAGNLESAMKLIIRKHCVEEGCRKRREKNQSTVQTCPHENALFQDRTCTKTVVLAITKDDIDAPPALLRTYDSSTFFKSCKIWEVARATSAAVGFFKPIKLGRDGIEFVDATFGYNNPCEVLIQEARKQFPGRCQMRILSIGTGLGDVITIQDSPTSIISALRKMATSSRSVARRLDDRFGGGSGQYFRFNVDQGLKDITLSDWEKASRISAHTRNYLAENERTIRRFVDSISRNVPTGGGIIMRKPAPDRVHFSVPFGRNKSFVGREAIMQRLLATVPPAVDTDDCQRNAVVGLGGVGKTQTALEVAFRVREKHPNCSIFWVPAMDAVGFRDAYRNIGQLLGIAGINDEKADVEGLVKSALSHESAGSWLMIVDSADNPGLFKGSTSLARHLPFSRQGSILFTSRNREVIVQLGVSAKHVFNVEGMSESEGFKFLEMHLTKTQMSNRKDTAKLLSVLGYLPLALRQATAYMAKKQISTTRYLELCRSSDKHMVELLSRDFEDSHRYKGTQNPVAATWLISFRQIAEHDSLAAEYLKFMSFLDEKAIPRSILPRAASELKTEDALGTLKAYAFITEREESHMYDMHKLVQLAMLNWLGKQGEVGKWAAKVTRCLDYAIPHPQYENREIWMVYLPHAQHILGRHMTGEYGEVNLLFKVGCCLQLLGQYREAETMHLWALQGREKFLGPDHPDTLAILDSLGIVLERQGQYERAETMFRRVLERRAKFLGPHHPNTLDSVDKLGWVFLRQGRYETAEAMFRRALEGREKVQGTNHLATFDTVSNLGTALRNCGKYEMAKAMHQRALEGKERVLGPDHPDTIGSVNNLAAVFQSCGQYDRAEQLYRRALVGLEKILGPDHPETLEVACNLGVALLGCKKYDRAEAMCRRALDGRAKVLGPDHPDTLASLNNLGHVLARQGKFEEAEAMLQRTLEGRERVLGPNHPDTIASINNVGAILGGQEQYERAEAMYRRAAAGLEKALGPCHPDTITTLLNLGDLLMSQGQYEKAEAVFRRAAEGSKKTLGQNHPNTVDIVNKISQIRKNSERVRKG
ncbi:hypothetical protein VTN49DRAFT_3963 [Thermomyces lanuginosus]|uniref:uncharacterized protein n=1 Tax=Thermomyces lanuginosus TaxID=5541 RepID=UPI00374367F6